MPALRRSWTWWWASISSASITGCCSPTRRSPWRSLPTLDILEELHTLLGHRLSLNHLAEKTLGEKKTGDGLLALELYAARQMGGVGILLPPGRAAHPPPLRVRGAITATCSTSTARATWCGCRSPGTNPGSSPKSKWGLNKVHETCSRKRNSQPSANKKLYLACAATRSFLKHYCLGCPSLPLGKSSLKNFCSTSKLPLATSISSI